MDDRVIKTRLAIALSLLLSCVPLAAAQQREQPASADTPRAYETRTVRVPNTTVSFDLVKVPAASDDSIPALWALKTEVPWELYDIFVYRLDKKEDETDADGIARPSKPYVPPDRGFGHDGYPAMGMTRAAAEAFCTWLSDTTGERFRLPTQAEWTHMAAPGATADAANAWTANNANHTTHPIAKKAPNNHGLHDTLGNVAEWVMSDDRRPLAMGGSYLDQPEACTPTSKQQQERVWNASDPQIPKSKWWLADCSWVGFRFVSPAASQPAEPNQSAQPDKEQVHER